jgi:hypothetical protein
VRDESPVDEIRVNSRAYGPHDFNQNLVTTIHDIYGI